MLFLKEMNQWANTLTDWDCHFKAAQFSIINRLFTKQLLFSAISNSIASFSSFSCSPSSSSWRFDWSRSRRVTTSLENVAPTTSRVHNSSTSLLLSRTMWWESWQLGSGTASQVKHQKLRSQNEDTKLDDSNMKWFNLKITKIFCLSKGAECTLQSCLWADRWQLLRLAAGRPFCNWDRWHDPSHLVPFPVNGIEKVLRYDSRWQKWIKLFQW